jgi:hypothetical protein
VKDHRSKGQVKVHGPEHGPTIFDHNFHVLLTRNIASLYVGTLCARRAILQGYFADASERMFFIRTPSKSDSYSRSGMDARGRETSDAVAYARILDSESTRL